MIRIRTWNRQLVLFAALCLIISLSAVIMNKFNNNAADIGIIGGADGPTSIFISGNDGEEDPGKRLPPLKDLAMDPEMLVLVNKQNALPSGYAPPDLLRIEAFAPGRDDSARYMRGEAAERLNTMLADALEEDVEIVMTTAYRSYELQRLIFESNVKKKGSVEEANKTSAKPGESEHQTGLAVDLTTPELNYEISYGFGTCEAGEWIMAHASEYGFILRYPKGKEEITGYSYEPWHLRYVGPDAAQYIAENDLTLEEFLSLLDQ